MGGGNGADTFYFFVKAGHDLVVDFNASDGDRIGLIKGVGFEGASYKPFLRATTIDFAGDNSVSILNATLAEVESAYYQPVWRRQ